MDKKIVIDEMAETTITQAEVTEALIEEKAKANRSGFWQVPNSYFKRVRQMSMNEVRAEVMRVASALIDQRNANALIMEENKRLREERVELNKMLEAQDVPQEKENA